MWIPVARFWEDMKFEEDPVKVWRNGDVLFLGSIRARDFMLLL